MFCVLCACWKMGHLQIFYHSRKKNIKTTQRFSLKISFRMNFAFWEGENWIWFWKWWWRSRYNRKFLIEMVTLCYFRKSAKEKSFVWNFVSLNFGNLIEYRNQRIFIWQKTIFCSREAFFHWSFIWLALTTSFDF